MESWSMTGSIFGSCNCDWGCPCNFDVTPSYRHCDGVYVFSVREGRYGEASLAGLQFAWAAHSPGPIHEGELTAVLIIDERATPAQRDALEQLWRSGAAGLPFDIFHSVTSTWLDTIYAPFESKLAGINSGVKIGANGTIYDLEQSRVKNPVTGDEEEIYLDKPTGFTAKRSELGMATRAAFSCDGLSWDTSGKHAEYGDFEYVGGG